MAIGDLRKLDLAVYVLDQVAKDFTPSEVFGDDDLKKHIRDDYSPDDVFPEKTLRAWAFDNGFMERE